MKRVGEVGELEETVLASAKAPGLSEQDKKFIRDLSYLIAFGFCDKHKLGEEACAELTEKIDEAVETCVAVKLGTATQGK